MRHWRGVVTAEDAMRIWQRLIWLALGVIAVARVTFGEEGVAPRTVDDLSRIKMEPRPALTDAEKVHIESLIQSLAEIDKPDWGMSSTVAGTRFVPVGGRPRWTMGMLGINHGLQTNSAFKELVALGPDALLILLKSLDDQTPTKLVFDHKDFMGAWYAEEVGINPANLGETDAVKDLKAYDSSSKSLDSYTVKIGDVCFVAIGEIVGRGYLAIRYQPSGCLVVNSPTYDAALRGAVRNIWKTDDPRQKVFESLRMDYTGGLHAAADDWYAASQLKCDAAQRLLFYYEKETSVFLAARLDGLDVAMAEGDAYAKRAKTAGVNPPDFIEALNWSSNSAIDKSLTAIFTRASDVDCMLAALPGVKERALVRRRLEEKITALPASERTDLGEGYSLLRAMAESASDAAKGVFVQYLEKGGTQRKATVCMALRGIRVPWDVDVLAPLLRDTEKLDSTYEVKAGDDKSRLPVRVCDEAAVTLVWNHQGTSFRQEGDYAELDRQIAAVRAVLVKK